MNEKEIKQKISSGYIYVRTIIEVVGYPKEYVNESLKSYLKKLQNDKSYMIVKETIEKAEKQENLFVTFAELELLVKNSISLLSFCFDYMPSSVEIIEPEQIVVKSNEFSGFLNDMQARLHTMNTGVINLTEKNKFYIRNTAVLLRNFIVVLLSSSKMTLKQMTPYLGVKEDDIKKVLDILIKEGKLKEQKGVYFAVPK